MKSGARPRKIDLSSLPGTGFTTAADHRGRRLGWVLFNVRDHVPGI